METRQRREWTLLWQNTGVRNRWKKRHGIKVQVADGKNMDQVQEGTVPFNDLLQDAADVQIYPHMLNPLMSCGKIVKKDHKIILDDPIATVISKDTNKVVMEAVFDQRTSTWNVYPNGPVPYEFNEEQKIESLGLGVKQLQGGYIIHLANNAYRLTIKKEIVEFYHAATGWPLKKTWIAAIQCNVYAPIQRDVYAPRPGLDKHMVRRHLKVRKPTILGHMNAQRLGTQSTKKKEKAGVEKMKCILAEENNSLEKPIPGILQIQERQVGVHLVSFDELKGYIATDVCGVYPTMSNYGMKYIPVLYDYDSNLISARAMKTKKGAAITDAYESINTELTDARITPILQYLDNETSKELIAAIKKNNLKYQLAAPPRSSIEPSRKSYQHLQEPLYCNLGRM